MFFCHVPKTGGSYMESILEPALENKNICKYYGDKRFYVDLNENFKKYFFFRGHISFYMHKIMADPCYTFTVLRDPIDRAFSAWKHINRDESLRLNEIIKKQNLSLEQLMDTKFAFIFSNLYTRYFGLDAPIRRMRRDSLAGKLSKAEYIKALRKRKFSKIEEKDFDRAMKNLQSLNHVGLTHKMDESLNVIMAELGLTRLDTVVNHNKAPESQKLTDRELAMREKLLDMNKWDMMLFNHFNG